MPQFITSEELFNPSPCAHDITTPKVFEDEGDCNFRASWILASTCKKCGEVFVYGSGMGFWSDQFK